MSSVIYNIVANGCACTVVVLRAIDLPKEEINRAENSCQRGTVPTMEYAYCCVYVVLNFSSFLKQ